MGKNRPKVKKNIYKRDKKNLPEGRLDLGYFNEPMLKEPNWDLPFRHTDKVSGVTV